MESEMTCTDLGPQLLEYLAGTLSDETLSDVRTHLAQCAACRTEVEAFSELWHDMGEVPAPRPDSGRMRARFNAALLGYIEGQVDPRPSVVSRSEERRVGK